LRYTPVQPPEGINVTDEHPLKSFFILTAGTIGVVIVVVAILGLAADYLVKYIPVEYEQDLFSKDSVYLMPFATDESIIVTKGLFSSVESENGLSMILAHEMAHHYERHPLRSTGRGLVVSIFLLTVLGADGSSFLQDFLGNTASITNLAFSRQQESDSDDFASDLLIKFYGHASGAAEFFQYVKSEESSIGEIPSFLSTHPTTEDRISNLIELENQFSGDKKPLPSFLNDYAAGTIEEE